MRRMLIASKASLLFDPTRGSCIDGRRLLAACNASETQKTGPDTWKLSNRHNESLTPSKLQFMSTSKLRLEDRNQAPVTL
jgi:hypothetical protein